MAGYEHSGVTVDLCHSCRGLWFDAGELRKVEDTPLTLAPASRRQLRLRTRYCPRCARSRLDQADVHGSGDLSVDHCDRCQGIFLEAGKLQRIQKLKAHRANRAAAEEARLRQEIRAAEQQRRNPRLARLGGGIEIQTATASGHFLAFLLDLPSEEESSTATKPYAVLSLIFVILAVWFWQLFFVPEGVWQSLAAAPDEILSGRHYSTLLTAMFLHGDWLHVLGNLYFLWVFSDNIEDRVGHLPFLVWYLAWGIFGGIAWVVMSDPAQQGLHGLGASGAISGAMGAYVILFPHNRFVAPLWGSVVIKLPAWCYLGFWIALQLYSAERGIPGVGWWAHIGGFAAGALTGAAYRWLAPVPRR